MRMLPSLSLLSLLLFTATRSTAIPAFPGAEGFGSETPGGRGGRVIEVTNLDDSGPGSLRAACEADGPRIVVFRTGGTIRLKSQLRIRSPFITIAGQTAPGGGILLRDAGLSIRTHDVVVRYIRVRIGESRAQSPGSQDCINIGGEKGKDLARNVIIDHCSLSWAIDENADSYSRASDLTVQWCILSEGLMKSIHEKGPHSMGFLLGQGSTRTSVHHNLFAHNNERNPRLKGGLRDIVNNVVYDWGSHAAALSDKPEVNLVGNCYKPGPSSGGLDRIVRADGPAAIYLGGNYFGEKGSDWDYVEPKPTTLRASSPFSAPKVTVCSANQAFDRVLRSAGCSYPVRDSVDLRIVRDAREGTGRIIDNPDQVGGFPKIASGIAPPDTDHDGMPDHWEIPRGLDPYDPSDGPEDRDRDGYTNLEEYLNWLVPDRT